MRCYLQRIYSIYLTVDSKLRNSLSLNSTWLTLLVNLVASKAAVRRFRIAVII